MPAPLETFLHMFTGGQQTLTPEMYAHYGGDDILKELQKYNPEAKWVDSVTSGGEGGEGTAGKKLDYGGDGLIRLPTPKSGIDFLNLRPENFSNAGVLNKNLVYDDDVYGRTTHAGNVKKESNGLETALPYIAAAIAMGGPMAAGALAGAGIGGAGLTSAVTGTGLGSASAPGWLTGLVKGGPGMMDKVKGGTFSFSDLLSPALGAFGVDPALGSAIKGGVSAATGKGFDPMAFLGLIGQQFGIDPGMMGNVKQGMTLAQLARNYGKRR